MEWNPGPCPPIPELAQSRLGYPGAEYVQAGYMPAVDFTLEPFDLVASVTTTAAGAAWDRVVAFAVPTGKYGLLQWYGQDAAAAGSFQTCQWRIVVNGGVRGQLIPALVQVAGITAANLCPYPLFLAPGDCVELQVLNSANPGEVVRGRLKGIVRGNPGEVHK